MLMTIMMLAAAASPTGEKTMAHDSWHALSIVGVAGSDGGSPLYLKVRAGDIDGDGIADEAALKLTCSGGAVSSASLRVISPRDSATGLATGKRQHGSVTIRKEWGPSTPQLSAMKPTYDIKSLKSARLAADGGGWTGVALGASEGLCAASEAARKTITKTSSNIQNN